MDAFLYQMEVSGHSCSRHFIPQGKRAPGTHWRLVGTSVMQDVVVKRKIPLLARNQIPAVQLIASHFTD